jgi:hypothetical protein
MRSVIGVDPGGTGSAVLIAPVANGRRVIPVRFSEFNDLECIEIFNAWDFIYHPIGLIEGVHSMPKDSKPNIFKFGGNYRAALIYFELAEIEYSILADPKTWQYEHRLGGKHGPLGCSPSKEKTARKNAHKDRAQEIFPELKVIHEIADGLLIAEYQWRLTNGGLTHGKRNTR